MSPPTTRQQQILDYLERTILSRGYGPTVREIGAHFGIRSPNGVTCHIRALKRKGLVQHEPMIARGLRLKTLPVAPRLRCLGKVS